MYQDKRKHFASLYSEIGQQSNEDAAMSSNGNPEERCAGTADQHELIIYQQQRLFFHCLAQGLLMILTN